MTMTAAALITWVCTALLGLVLLAIWLIEYDPEFQRAAATRLPVPVIFLHAALAVGGLVVWAAYLLEDMSRLAWTAVIMLGVVVPLGMVMAVRWIPVRRAKVAARRTGSIASPELRFAAERNFPLPVVAAHGLFAAVTVTLVLASILGAS
jgi:hypothetical protein